RHCRTRVRREETRGRRFSARTVACVVRAGSPALPLLPRASRRGGAPYRNSERTGRAETGSSVAHDRRRGLDRGFSEARPPLVTAPDSFEVFLSHVRARIDDALERSLPRPPECPAVISEAMRYSVFAGGKRLRPTLTLAAADAVARSRHPHNETASAQTAEPDVRAAIDAALPA